MIVHPWTVTLRHETHVPVDVPSALLYLACAVGVGLLTRRRPALGVDLQSEVLRGKDLERDDAPEVLVERFPDLRLASDVDESYERVATAPEAQPLSERLRILETDAVDSAPSCQSARKT